MALSLLALLLAGILLLLTRLLAAALLLAWLLTGGLVLLIVLIGHSGLSLFEHRTNLVARQWFRFPDGAGAAFWWFVRAAGTGANGRTSRKSQPWTTV